MAWVLKERDPQVGSQGLGPGELPLVCLLFLHGWNTPLSGAEGSLSNSAPGELVGSDLSFCTTS